MSQVDSRNSSAAKRARTDGGRREDDWTCSSCGNVNFSFRTTCNMRNCTQPRPADHLSKSAAKHLQPPPSYPPAAPYVGSSASSSLYIGLPPYHGSSFNGPSPPPYDPPFPGGGAAYHYNYGSRINGGSPYRPPLHLSAPAHHHPLPQAHHHPHPHPHHHPHAPYPGGSMLGNGGLYGLPPLVDRYGLPLPLGSAAAMGPRPGFYPDEKAQKRDGTRDSDWICPKCSNVNFSFRSVCNMRKCNTPKPGTQGAKSGKNAKPDMPEGSWKCEKCNNVNYPFRTKCNRQNCGADKPSESKNSSPKSEDETDQ